MIEQVRWQIGFFPRANSSTIIGPGFGKREVHGMPSVAVWCQWLEHTSLGLWVRDSRWAFSVIETVHLFGIVSLVGSTSVLDLRFWGVLFKDEPVTGLVERLVPWAWAGFAVQVVTGFLLFSSEASRCSRNNAFLFKMVLILLAGVNMLVFHTATYKRVARWDSDAVSPIAAKLAGLFSILLWFGIVAAGRWIAYVG